MMLMASLAAVAAVTASEPHAAAELWDASFASREACETALKTAIREAGPEPLRRLYLHAECYVAGDAQKQYRVRPRWARRSVRSAPPR